MPKKEVGGGVGVWGLLQASAGGGLCTDASRLHESFIASALLKAIFSSEADARVSQMETGVSGLSPTLEGVQLGGLKHRFTPDALGSGVISTLCLPFAPIPDASR